METVIQIDDRHAFAFGMTWLAVDPMISRGSQLKEIRAGHSAKWIASSKVFGQESIGYAKDLILPTGIETLSAAGQVALSAACKGKTVFVLMEEEGHDGAGNDVGIVAMIDGHIKHDAWVKVSGVEELRLAFQQQCARAGTVFETVGHTITLPVSQQLHWDDLLPKPRATGLGKFKSVEAVRVLPLTADIPTWVLLTVVSVAAIGIGLWFWNSSVAEKNRIRKLSMRPSAPDPAQLYAVAATQYLAQPVLPAAQVIRELRTQLKEFPVQLAGWNLTRIDCTAAGCGALWTRKFGTYKEFVDRAPKAWGEVQLHSDGTKIAHAVPVKLATAALPAQTSWPAERAFILDVVSKWQKYSDVKFKADLQAPALMAVPPAVQPQAAAAFPNAIWAMKWGVKDSQWWMSEALFNLPDNVTVDSVSLVFGPEINFNVEGKVYVHK